MKIAISGASGFVGTYLSHYWQVEGGYGVLPIDRMVLADDIKLNTILSQSDIVVNLAGASINARWTESYKKELYDSRILTTRKIVNAINQLDKKPKLLISASAVGYYPSQGSYDEYNSIKGDSFLSDLCMEWESEVQKISKDVRLAICRFGVVLANKGGALEKMMFPLKFGITPIIGTGNQPFPWIDIQDLARSMDYVINTSNLNGVINFVAPQQITNKELMEAAALHSHSLFKLNIPIFVFRILLGESAQVLTDGQMVFPRKLLDFGFEFKSKTISDFFDQMKK